MGEAAVDRGRKESVVQGFADPVSLSLFLQPTQETKEDQLREVIG